MNGASVALAARIVLAVVLVMSAIGKTRSRVAVESEMGRHVGVRLAPLIAPVLPGAEVLIAVALVAWWSPVPGIVALLMLIAFTVVLVRAQMRQVPCLCFGASRLETPVGAAGVLRNGVLAAFAVLAIGEPNGALVGATLIAGAGFGAVAALVVRPTL